MHDEFNALNSTLVVLSQEDELAINALSGGTSPYMPLVFMDREKDFRPFFTFEQAQPQDRARWIECFMFFLRKVALLGAMQDGSNLAGGRPGTAGTAGRRMLLKSPVHTARIKLLLELFPDAQFLYIHRDPFTVFKSAAHMADTTCVELTRPIVYHTHRPPNMGPPMQLMQSWTVSENASSTSCKCAACRLLGTPHRATCV